jgi:hypothetical protein
VSGEFEPSTQLLLITVSVRERAEVAFERGDFPFHPLPDFSVVIFDFRFSFFRNLPNGFDPFFLNLGLSTGDR